MEAPAADGSVSTSSGAKAIQGLLESHREWAKAVVYDQDGKVLAATFDVDLNDIEDLLPLFNDEDNAFRFGIDLAGEHYDVHRFYETLVYGRKVDQKTGDGICICRTRSGEKAIFVLITYAFPTLSAKAVPDLQNFCKTHVEPLLSA